MEKTSFENKLFGVLKQNPDFLSTEGEVLKDRVIDSAYKADRKLIELLLENAEIKKKFFSEIQGHWVFNINDFVMFVQDKHFLNDSYTRYKNKIGLTIDGKFLNERKEVALVWPFKDAVLEGGMTKEDQKKKEIFFNEILAQDEIDKLLAPKVLTNWKRYTAKGEEEVKELKRDESGTIKENLIIKGNNLLALHTLKEQFREKVKLIYIDPPYNTGNDGFKYNDNFNHSTWLTFMKNRLEIAKDLLTSDGSIYINIDQKESHYLKILCDQIFWRENFQNEIAWLYTGGTDRKSGFNRKHDSILFYSRTENFFFNNTYEPFSDATIKRFNKVDKDGRKYKENKLSDGRITKTYMKEEGKKVPDYWYFPIVNRTYEEWCGIDGQKPEALLQRIVEASSSEGDIVLDFFAGSGTSGAVAHKMNRQWLMIEQMEYIHNLPESRMKRVMEGEQGGISKSVNWKGGGDFIYCELMKYNESFVEEIEKSKDTKTLLNIWKQIKEKAFFKHNFEMQEFENNIEEFKNLDLEKQKQVLFGVLDKNQLYVNYSEIEDKKFKVDKRDKEINKEFYEKR